MITGQVIQSRQLMTASLPPPDIQLPSPTNTTNTTNGPPTAAMPTSTFSSHPVAFRFSSGALTVTPAGGDPATTIPQSQLICLLPTPYADTYTLVHHVSDDELLRTQISHPPDELVSRLLLRSLPAHLAAARVTAVVSTTSGGGGAVRYWESVLEPLLSELGVAADVVRTTAADSITSTVAALAGATADDNTVILLAGDGGVHEAVNAVADGGLTLALLPFGTGNAVASSYHSSRGYPALHALLFGTPRPLPTFAARFGAGARWTHGGEVCSTRGAVVVSWGFHASLVADAEELRGDGVGVERFQQAARKGLQDMHAYRGVVEFRTERGGEWQQQQQQHGSGHFYVLATMCSNLEARLTISPHSTPGERALHLVYFAAVETPKDALDIMEAAYAGGSHIGLPAVEYRKIAALRITVDDAEEEAAHRRVCIDGATVVLPRGGHVEVAVEEGGAKPGVKLVWV